MNWLRLFVIITTKSKQDIKKTERDSRGDIGYLQKNIRHRYIAQNLYVLYKIYYKQPYATIFNVKSLYSVHLIVSVTHSKMS